MRVFPKILVVVGWALLLAHTAAAQQEDVPIGRLTGTLAKVHDAGEITLGYRADSFPFSYLDAANHPVGYSLDLCGANRRRRCAGD
jgi:glutamate/aspartate transport system substrate-binding protein